MVFAGNEEDSLGSETTLYAVLPSVCYYYSLSAYITQNRHSIDYLMYLSRILVNNMIYHML